MNKAEKVSNLIELYKKLLPEIEKRLDSFKKVWDEGNEERIFEELIFCILTPQSKAEICWRAVENLKAKGLIYSVREKEIIDELKGVRFREKKASYIAIARKKFDYFGRPKLKGILGLLKDSFEMRDWLVKNVKGIGYKEASHFLRNIGMGENLAILDRHVLGFMVSMGFIEKVPKNMTRKRYLEIEDILRRFSQEVGIPLAHLDFVLWYNKTGRIFK